MNPLDLTELRALLDALCEESITAEQLKRLEEIVLAHPEAEAHYVQFMSLHADLMRHFRAMPALPPQLAAHSGATSDKSRNGWLSGFRRRRFIWGATTLGAMAASIALAYML